MDETFNTCVKLGARFDIKDNEDKLPLHYACERSTFDMVKTIIEKEPQQVNAKSSSGWTPLHFCALTDKCLTSKAELLIKRGANVNELDDYGKNVLHRASYFGRLELVKLFVERT